MAEKNRRVTIKDVATLAGVSPATVSNVLLGRKLATPAVADRVRQAAKTLDYVVDRAASHLRSGKAKVIGIVVPSLEDPFFTSVIAAIEAHAQESGYDTLVAASGHNDAVEGARLVALLSWRLAGIFVIPNSDAAPNLALIEGRVPLVVLDRVPPGFSGDSVEADNRDATARATDYLLGQGHRDLLVIGSSFALHNIRERYAGAAATLEARGLPHPAKLEVGLSFETVADSMQAWRANHPLPSALLTLTSFATMGVLAHLSNEKVRIARDVSLIGFDDYAWMRAATPAISAVRQDIAAMAQAAWTCLASRMAGDGGPAKQISVPCNLVIRASVNNNITARAAPRAVGSAKPPASRRAAQSLS